ncbi:hypothetical protein RND81_01G004800 [Saponaria officinalis]|uniref:DUF295 domain-containing protein n=1 Tax=Saponaria officinalis TaxID=3572 RepID=A0AAW1NB06_SAPOF
MCIEQKWSEINDDILQTITEFLKTYSDYIRVRSVCRTWRKMLPHFPQHRLPTQLPWLLLSSSSSSSSSTSAVFRCAFYYFPTAKTYTLHVPEASYPRRIVGSSHGFLVLVGDSPDIFCFNPLTKFKAFLAPLSTLPGVVSFSFSNVGREYSIQDPSFQNVYTLDLRQICDVFLSKVILSSSPTKDASLAIAIISWSSTTELAYCKCGDSSWKSFPFGNFSAQDVIYCPSKELFYAVNQIGDVAFFSPPNTPEIIRNVDTIEGDLKYLVKSNGELLLVSRYLEAEADLVSYSEVYQTTGFRVYKFNDAGEGRVHWEPMTDLGDQMVFIGNNLSLSLSASDFEGCKGNCIYYADDHSEKADAGVYDLSNDCIEALPCYPHDGSSPLSLAPPVWFTSNPC